MEDGGIESENIVRNLQVEVRQRDEIDSEERDGEKRQKVDEEEFTPKQGGLLDNLLSKLSSPRATSKPSDDNFITSNGHDVLRSDNGGVEDGGAGGGVIDNIISFFHKSEEEDVKVNGGDQDNNNNNNNEESEAAKKGVLDQENEAASVSTSTILSNLVPDNVGPASDEASILIHSVVHD